MEKEHLYANAWKLCGCRNKDLFQLEKTCNNLETAWLNSNQYQPKINHWEKINNAKKNINPEQEYGKLQKNGIHIITKNDAIYPPMLIETPDAPYALYVRGQEKILSHKSLAIVGSRAQTHYGESIIENIVPPLVESGLTIVSGLALGTDGHAHRATLAQQGQTIAVLGSGLDDFSIAPRSHQTLAKNITEAGGVLLSEYPLGTPGYPGNFPERNRIIAGLAIGTILTEAKERSGALITARFAAEMGREVWVFPGNAFSIASEGSNQFIQKGAALVTNANDILFTLAETLPKTSSQKPHIYSDGEKMLLTIIKNKTVHIDDMLETTQLPLSELMSIITTLEEKNVIISISPLTYQLRHT